MADRFEDLSNALLDETLTEMAETFFGGRKEAEVLLERFQKMADDLQEVRDDLLRTGRTVHILLLDRESAREFWERLGTDFRPFLENFDPGKGDASYVKRPFAFTFKGRFKKILVAAYADLHDKLDAYLHGHYIADEERPGRKRLTVNRDTVQDLAWRINNKIESLNQNLNPTQMLCYIQSLNPEEQEKRNITGCSNMTESGLDEAFRFDKIDFESLGFPDLPDIPGPSEAASEVKRHALMLASSRKDDAEGAVKKLAGGD